MASHKKTQAPTGTCVNFKEAVFGCLFAVAEQLQQHQEQVDEVQIEPQCAHDDGTVTGRKAIMGALRLYLDFINLFLMLLQLFGNRE